MANGFVKDLEKAKLNPELKGKTATFNALEGKGIAFQKKEDLKL